MVLRFLIPLASLLLLLISAQVGSAQIAVIAHPSVPVDSMSKSRIVDLFTGDVRVWDNGVPVVPLDLQEPKELRKTFYKLLGKSPSRMRSIWMKRKLSGEGDVPASVKDENEAIAKVAATPGSVSFVRASAQKPSVKVLRIVESP